MHCTWKNTKCRKSKTLISPLKNRPTSMINFGYKWRQPVGYFQRFYISRFKYKIIDVRNSSKVPTRAVSVKTKH